MARTEKEAVDFSLILIGFLSDEVSNDKYIEIYKQAERVFNERKERRNMPLSGKEGNVDIEPF